MTVKNMKTYEIALLQAKAYRALQQYMASFLKEYDITAMEWTLLSFIADSCSEGVKVTDIAEAFNVEVSLITTTLNKLASKDFVTRTTHENDQRVRLIKASPEGLALVKQIETALEPIIVGKWLGGLSPQVIKDYVEVLEYIIENKPV